jgi:hypothetical protein
LKREEEILETEKEIETLKNKLNYPTEASWLRLEISNLEKKNKELEEEIKKLI